MAVNQSFIVDKILVWGKSYLAPNRPLFAQANFQLSRKGQRSKGSKVKRQNFHKIMALKQHILIESRLCQSSKIPNFLLHSGDIYE